MWYCLIYIVRYLISRLTVLFSFCFVPNSRHFVLSSPKWMLSLLSTNQSQISEKFLIRFSDLSTWKNCLPWHFDYNSIQNTSILGGAVNCWFLPLDFFLKWPNNPDIATVLVLLWIYVAITKIKHKLKVVQGYLLAVLVQFKVHAISYH